MTSSPESAKRPASRPGVAIHRSASIVLILFILPLVALDYSILDVDDTVSVLGDVMLVGDQHDRISFTVQTVK